MATIRGSTVILKGFQIGTDQVIDFNQKKRLIDKRLYHLICIPGLSKISFNLRKSLGSFFAGFKVQYLTKKCNRKYLKIEKRHILHCYCLGT